MPNYDYSCPICNITREVFKWVSEVDRPEVCPRCRERMSRLYNDCTVIGIEFKSGVAFNPVAGKDTAYHGSHFDVGAGRWFNDKNERKAWMKSRGVREIGDAPDKPLNLRHVKEESMLAKERIGAS